MNSYLLGQGCWFPENCCFVSGIVGLIGITGPVSQQTFFSHYSVFTPNGLKQLGQEKAFQQENTSILGCFSPVRVSFLRSLWLIGAVLSCQPLQEEFCSSLKWWFGLDNLSSWRWKKQSFLQHAQWLHWMELDSYGESKLLRCTVYWEPSSNG